MPSVAGDGRVAARFERAFLERIVGGGVAALDERVGDYALIERIGEGGMGEVWRADHEVHGTVALKLLRRSTAMDPRSRRRFLREARAAATLDHPGIVDIFDVGETSEGRPFIAMELVDGKTLRRVIEEESPLPWTRALELWTQIAQALGEAHRNDLVHRDIKPSNILVESLDAQHERCRIIDFGLVRAVAPDASTELTSTGQLVGTPSYISPEALRGDAVDGRSDQYSLGILVYELLESTRPFEGRGLEELFLQHLLRPPPPPNLTQVPMPLRAQVRAVLQRMLSKSPDDRFASMRALLGALRAIRPGGRAVRLPNQRRRWWWIPASAAGLTGLALAGWWVNPSADSVASAPAETRGPSRATVELTTGVGLSCALSEAGEVRCWGANSKGRLGMGTRGQNVGDNESPQDVPALTLRDDAVPQRLFSGPDARHVCMLDRDHRVDCWGDNSHGELGLGHTEDWGDSPDEPVAALPGLPLEDVDVLALGGGFTCALSSSGTVKCWGKGDAGVRGDGTTESLGDDEPLSALRPVSFGGRQASGISAGKDHACAVLRPVGDGAVSTVRCWGQNTHGQLGVQGWAFAIGDGAGNGLGRGGVPADPSLAVTGLHEVDIASVHAAGQRSCAVTMAGGVRCWGDGALTVLGYRPEDLPQCDVDCDLDTPPPFDLPLGATTVQLSLGEQHACALDPVGAVRCWGVATWGRIGDGEATDAEGMRVLPARDSIVDLGDFDADGTPDPVAQLSAANWHTCARVATGGVRCWGRGITGRLGYRSSDNIGDNETPAAYYAAAGYADVPLF